MWLGATAALSGAVTLAYLLVRSSRKGRGNVAPSKATETHAAWGSKTGGNDDSQNATIKKDGSCERLNGHLPMEGQADSVSGMPLSADCKKEAKQQDFSESTLTSSEASEVSVSVERLSNSLEENLSEIVCAVQEKIVNEDNASNASVCEEVNVRLHIDDKEPTPVKDIVTNTTHPLNKQQDKTENNGETSDCVITCAVKEKITPASSEKELLSNAPDQEAICLDTDLLSLEGAACSTSRQTEPSLASQEPVVEELSQCLILEPQCDPSCCEGHDEVHHHTTFILPPESTKCSSESVATVKAEEVTQKNTETEISGITPERHYTLVLKSSQEDLCISGKHIHDPSPTEPAFAEEFTEGQESGAELNKDEPGTCIVTVERREKVYEKEISPSSLASTQMECLLIKESVPSECCAAEGEGCSGDLEADERTVNDNKKEGTVLETDSNMGHPIDAVAVQTLTTEQEQSIKEGGIQDQGENDNKQEIPQEQKNLSEQKHNSERQEYSEDKSLAPKVEEDSHKEQTLSQEQNKISSKQEESIKEQELSGSDQIVPKEEEQSNYKQTEVPEEQNLSQGREMKETQQQEGESKQEVVVQKQKVNQEEQSGSAQETASKQDQNDSKQISKKQEQGKNKPESRQSPKQSSKQQSGAAQKQEHKKKPHRGSVEHKQGNSSKQKQEQEATQKQKEGDRKQKANQKEEQSAQKGGMQKQKDINRKENVTQKEEQSISKEVSDKMQNEPEVKSSHKEDTGTQKQEEGDNKQQVTQGEEQSEEVTPPEQSDKDQVTGDQVTLSPSRGNSNSSGGKKGAVRSRGDSASADLDLDIGSEQDNLNCDSSSLVNDSSVCILIICKLLICYLLFIIIYLLFLFSLGS